MASSSNAGRQRLKIILKTGDLFADAPDDAIVVHACNCQGTWGKGIATQFAMHFPMAFETYKVHCRQLNPTQLKGTALLIPPKRKGKQSVGCLFTSKGFGSAKDDTDMILESTDGAMRDLVKQILEFRKIGDCTGDLWMPKINAGLFGVAWEKTEEVMESLEFDFLEELPNIVVVEREQTSTV